MAGIYIHVPFCKKACHYCDFHFSTNLKTKSELLYSILKEIENRKEFFNENDTISTIYFGGGTPSILSSKELDEILTHLRIHFNIRTVEITLEANPDDIDLEKLKAWKAIGINRLSIGVQSFNDNTLKFMNRCHTGTEAIESIELAKKVGFENLNLDLIFGIPKTDNSIFLSDLETITKLQPNHISTYCLTIEPDTVFGRRLEKGKLQPIEDDFSNEQYNFLCQYLKDYGYDQYEISNFSKPGAHSKHNLAYWQNKKFLGLGPSAHSYDGNHRFINVSSNSKYINQLKNHQPFFEIETLTNESKMNEYVLTKIRTKWGINLDDIKNMFSEETKAHIIRKAQPWIQTGHLISQDKSLILSQEGKLLADSICESLFH